MYKRGTLTSIPELENEEETGKKWVPKKKHEVLKAKYKCLKKLFQIYDASVIGELSVGILPEPTPESPRSDDESKSDRKRRRKRSHRTKTDACAGTNEIASGDNISAYDNTSIATGIIRELTVDQSCISTQMDAKIDKFSEATDDSYSNGLNYLNYCQIHNCLNCQYCQQDRLFKEKALIPQLYQNVQHMPYMGCETRKLTRFQCFIQRLFGIRKEAYKPAEKMYAASDPVLTSKEKRRRRGLRFRRIKRAKKVRSDSALRDMKDPSILSYVQSVQRQCLMDTTPRKCPIPGCNMISYGIINYNDHLNLCHFKDRKYVCHYCHEGFETEYDKLMHENEHIGISKLGVKTYSSIGQTYKMASNTQTEPEPEIPEDKLKKIVSFFDKISDPEQMMTEIKKSRSSETNLPRSKDTSSGGSSTELSESQTRAASCCNVRRAAHACGRCDEAFTCRRQFNLHANSEHCAHDRFTKYHSCAGIVRAPASTRMGEGSINVHSGTNLTCRGVKRVDTATTLDTVAKRRSDDRITTCDPGNNVVSMLTEEGTINVQSGGNSCRGLKRVDTATTIDTVAKRRSDVTVTSCETENTVAYYSSMESLENKTSTSVVDSVLQKVRSYRWEPGTKILRV